MQYLLLLVIFASFITLGFPDALIGAAWPAIYADLGVPISYAGMLSMILSVGTVAASLRCDRIVRKIGAGWLTAIGVSLMAVSLVGFTLSGSLVSLCLWAIPYGLGAGSIDACLNNYVAVHYNSRYVSWLHCMWGVGASLAPYLMSFALNRQQGWNTGFFYAALVQVVVVVFVFVSQPLWKMHAKAVKVDHEDTDEAPLTILQVLKLSGAPYAVGIFFFYGALERTISLWLSSYLNVFQQLSEESAAATAGLFFIGITAGRMLCGFLTAWWSDVQMLRLGQCVIGVGLVLLLIPSGGLLLQPALLLIGLGCSPVYPCNIHLTPIRYGAARSQAMIGVAMAGSFAGKLLMAPLFGVFANHGGIGGFPIYLLLCLVIMFILHEKVQKICGDSHRQSPVK